MICSGGALLVLIPYLNFKKQNPGEARLQPLESFYESQRISWPVRREMALVFFAQRVDYTRELGYVAGAVERGWIELRQGATYQEALLQMIPRFLWSEKPSYNTFTGYYLPRLVGLLGAEDDDTSWSVNLFAEFLWNYPVSYLVGFVPLVFVLFELIDWLANRYLLNASASSLCLLALFFQTFQIVSIVNATTFLLWTVLLMWLFDLSLRRSETSLTPEAIAGNA
jgi:hypothetical protein